MSDELKLKQFTIGDELTQEQKDSIDADRDSILGAIKLVESDTDTTWQLSGSSPEPLNWTKRDSNGHYVPCGEDDPDKIEFGDIIYDLGNDRYSFSRELFVAMLQVQVDKAVATEREACIAAIKAEIKKQKHYENIDTIGFIEALEARGEKPDHPQNSAQVIGQEMAKSAIEHWEGLWE